MSNQKKDINEIVIRLIEKSNSINVINNKYAFFTADGIFILDVFQNPYKNGINNNNLATLFYQNIATGERIILVESNSFDSSNIEKIKEKNRERTAEEIIEKILEQCVNQ